MLEKEIFGRIGMNLTKREMRECLENENEIESEW